MNLPVDLGDFHQHDTCHTERTREGQRKMWSLTSEERQAISNLIVWSCLLFLSGSLFSKDIVQHSDNSVQWQCIHYTHTPRITVSLKKRCASFVTSKNHQMSPATDCVTKFSRLWDERKINTWASTRKTGPPTAGLIKKSSDGRQP